MYKGENNMKFMGKSKAIAATILSVAVLLTSSSAVFAANQTEVQAKSVRSEKGSAVITPNSVVLPTAGWNIATQGGYYFAGWSNTQTLYTDYYFIGKTSYHLHVYAAKAMTVRVRDLNTGYTYSTKNMATNSFAGWDVFGNGMTASSQIYISFSGTNIDFNGTIN